MSATVLDVSGFFWMWSLWDSPGPASVPQTHHTQDSRSWGEGKNREKKETFLLLLFAEPNPEALVFKGLGLIEL